MLNSMQQMYPSIDVILGSIELFLIPWTHIVKAIQLIQQIFIKYCCISGTVLDAWNMAVNERGKKAMYLSSFPL